MKKPQRDRKLCSLIIPPDPQGIWKQPEHDSANWLCWLDIHHARSDAAEEQAQPAIVVQIPAFLPLFAPIFANMIITTEE